MSFRGGISTPKTRILLLGCTHKLWCSILNGIKLLIEILSWALMFDLLTYQQYTVRNYQDKNIHPLMRCSKEIPQGVSEAVIHPQFCRALKQIIFREDTKNQKDRSDYCQHLIQISIFTVTFHCPEKLILSTNIPLITFTELALTYLYLVLTFFLFQTPSYHCW